MLKGMQSLNVAARGMWLNERPRFHCHASVECALQLTSAAQPVLSGVTWVCMNAVQALPHNQHGTGGPFIAS